MVIVEKVMKIRPFSVNFWKFEIHREIQKFNLIMSFMILDWKIENRKFLEIQPIYAPISASIWYLTIWKP